jgi:hypothetical protein
MPTPHQITTTTITYLSGVSGVCETARSGRRAGCWCHVVRDARQHGRRSGACTERSREMVKYDSSTVKLKQNQISISHLTLLLIGSVPGAVLLLFRPAASTPQSTATLAVAPVGASQRGTPAMPETGNNRGPRRQMGQGTQISDGRGSRRTLTAHVGRYHITICHHYM